MRGWEKFPRLLFGHIGHNDHILKNKITLCTPTQSDMLASPGHIVVVVEIILQPGLHAPLVRLPTLHVHHQGH